MAARAPYRPHTDVEIQKARAKTRESLGPAVLRQPLISALTDARHAGWLVAFMLDGVWYRAKAFAGKRRPWTAAAGVHCS